MLHETPGAAAAHREADCTESHQHECPGRRFGDCGAHFGDGERNVTDREVAVSLSIEEDVPRAEVAEEREAREMEKRILADEQQIIVAAEGPNWAQTGDRLTVKGAGDRRNKVPPLVRTGSCVVRVPLPFSTPLMLKAYSAADAGTAARRAVATPTLSNFNMLNPC